MTARAVLDEYLRLVKRRKYIQGSVQREMEVEEGELLAKLYDIADEYDNTMIVPDCPHRDDPDHWKVNCFMCEHEGERIISLRKEE